MPVSAEGRVGQQKQNQMAAPEWSVGFAFGVQLDYSCQLKSVSSDGENHVGLFLHRFIEILKGYK